MADIGVHIVGVVAAAHAVDVVPEANQEPIGTAKEAGAERGGDGRRWPVVEVSLGMEAPEYRRRWIDETDR